MSNLPPNPYNNVPGGPQVKANPAATAFNHSQQFGQVPLSQLPPGFAGTKQDANSNSPMHSTTSVPPNNALSNVNNYNQSGSNSPAFNQPGIMPPAYKGLQASPMKQPASINTSAVPSNMSSNSGSPSPFHPNPSPTPYPQNAQPQRQVNDNAPPLIPSSQFNQSPMNGPSNPPMSNYQGAINNQFPATSTPYSSPQVNRPSSGVLPGGNIPLNQAFGPPLSKPTGPMTSQPNIPFTGSLTSPPRGSPLMQGPSINGPPGPTGPPLGHPGIISTNGPPLPSSSGAIVPPKPLASGLPLASKPGPYLNGPTMSGAPISNQPMSMPGQSVGRPPLSGPQASGLMSGSTMTRAPGHPMTGPQGPMGGPQGPMGGPQGPMGGPQGPMVGPQGSMGGPQGPMGGPQGLLSRPSGPPMSGTPSLPPMSGPPTGLNMSGPPLRPPNSGTPSLPHMSSHQTMPPLSGPPSMPPMSGPPSMTPMSGPPSMPHLSGPPAAQSMSGPQMNRPPVPGTQAQPFNGPPRSGPMGPPGPQSLPAQITNQNVSAQLPPRPLQPQPPIGPPGPGQLPTQPAGPPRTNLQNRYPQMQQPQPASAGSNPQMPPQPMGQYPQQYTTQNMTQQMGNMSVTRQGFDQLWGHQTMDLMQCKNILPEYPEEMPEIKLGPAFPDAVNCSPEIFRCTVNRIPESNSLLQKSRLPLGILIHPFKDLNHLPVIQCNTIVRCRSCRTYINPFVYFVDAKRWKCNLCFRVNDLPEEFLFDPVSKSYGDPSRRPEIKSATIEFIAPGEYMLRPPQPAVYLFLLDVSQIARDSGYLQVVCDTLLACLDELPGDARTQIGFICFDSHVHYYLMSEGLQRPKEMTVLDIDEVFLPSPESLLVNLGERKELVKELLTVLPQRYSGPGVPTSALGAALQAAYKLMAPTGGRITVFQTCLPNVGPGSLLPREDPNARSSKDVAHLNPATDFYKRIALDCSGAQICVDLFLLNSQYTDLATLSGMSKFSGGTVYHIPLYKTSRSWQAEQLNKMFARYLTRKIGFEAVMRVRATRGISIHTFHGNFFVRSTDLLSLPNVSPDAGFGMQLAIDESLKDLQHVCFQAALLYTSSKGERRIRVHTMSLPIATTLSDVLHSADTQCIIGLLSKMAVDRAQSASLGEAREALMHVAVEALSAHRLAQNLPAGVATSALHAPHSLRLLPLFLLALLKRKAFRTGTSTRLDDRVADMCALKSQPLSVLMRALYPHLYPLHDITQHCVSGDDDELMPDPPRLHLSAERVNSNGAYLLDDGETMIIYVGRNVSPAFLSETFGVAAFSQIPDEARSLPKVDSDTSALVHAFIERLNEDRPYASDILVLRDNSPSKLLFTERLVDDRVESAFSYYEFLQHVKNQVK